MKFRAAITTLFAFLCLSAWVGTSQADPIEKALKLIRISSKPIKPSSKLRRTSVPKDTNRLQANEVEINQIEAANILYQRLFTKDSTNPVLFHALALLPNKKENDAQLHEALTALQYWGKPRIGKSGEDKSAELWKKYEKKYKLNYSNTDTLVYELTQTWWTRMPNYSLEHARKLLKEIEFNHDRIYQYQVAIQHIEDERFRASLEKLHTPPDTAFHAPKFESIALKSHHKLIDFQKEYIERLEFDSLMHSRDINALSIRRNQLLKIKKPTQQVKMMIQQAEDTLLQWEFELACNEDQEYSYLRFLQAYPKAPQKNVILQKLDAMAFERAQQLNTVEAYEYYLKNQPAPPVGRQDLTMRAQFLLRALTVIPVPFAYSQKEGFYFADSSTGQSWMELDYKMAYPFALNNNKSQFVENGSTLIPGCALVMRTDTFGLIEYSYITKDGKPFTKNNYETIYQFSSSMAFVQRGGRWGILNYRGKELLPCKFENLRYDTAARRGALKTNKKWALFNENGKLLTPPKYDAIGFETWENEPTESPAKLWIKNRCAAQINGNWALIDTLGNSLTPFAYESMTSLPFGRYMGKINDGYCLWRDTIQCSAEYSEAVDFGKPYTLVQQKGWGIIDTLGRILVPPIYEKALLVGSTVALLKNKKWNFYYSRGEFNLPIKGAIDDFRMHGDGMVFVRQKKNWILYHAYTKTVRKVKTTDIQQLTDTLLLEPIGNSGFITHANGKVLLSDSLIGLSKLNDHEWLASKTTGTGLLCLPSMQWSLKPIYQEIIVSQKPSHYMVKRNEKWGVVNSFGDVIVPISYDAITDTEYPGYWYALQGDKTLWINSTGTALVGK